MPLPSFYLAKNNAAAWSVTRAAGYGALIGVFAAVLKTLGPLRATSASGNPSGHLAAGFAEIAGAALAFALLCAGAAALRNFISRRLVWHDGSY
jgi:hypothetical protein